MINLHSCLLILVRFGVIRISLVSFFVGSYFRFSRVSFGIYLNRLFLKSVLGAVFRVDWFQFFHSIPDRLFIMVGG